MIKRKMNIIKSNKGFILYKTIDNSYIIEAQNKMQANYGKVSELRAINMFNSAIERGWFYVDKEYYTISFLNRKAIVRKHKKQIRSNKEDLFLKNHYISKKQAIKATKHLLPLAGEKYSKVIKAYHDLHKELDFESGYHYEGDSYGIYNEYEYIRFKIENVEFTYTID